MSTSQTTVHHWLLRSLLSCLLRAGCSLLSVPGWIKIKQNDYRTGHYFANNAHPPLCIRGLKLVKPAWWTDLLTEFCFEKGQFYPQSTKVKIQKKLTTGRSQVIHGSGVSMASGSWPEEKSPLETGNAMPENF